ncbi:MAG: hypothetical protein WED09_06035 [Homoserinimonas sp.]
MIIESLVILSMLVGGSAVVRVAGLRGWGVPILGSVAGVSLYISIGAVQVLSPITSSSILTMSLTAGIPIAVWLWNYFRGRDVRIKVLPAIALMVGVISLIALFRAARLVAWSSDSFRYLLNASLIATDNFDSASTALIPKRLIGVPLLHAPSGLSGSYYLPSIAPLIAALALALIAWLAWNGLSVKHNKWTVAIVTTAGLLTLATTNRFVFHGFYINGHLLFGALLLAVVGCSWIMVVDSRVSRQAMLLVMGLAIVALVFVRAETALLVGFALLPTLLDRRFSHRTKAALLALLGVPLIAWQSFVASVYLEEGSGVPLSVSGLLAAGIVMVAGIPALRWKGLNRWGQQILLLAEIGLWLALGMLALQEPEVLIDSIAATTQNTVLGAASWGLSLIMLVGLTVLAAFLKVPDGQLLRFPLTTFVPFVFLLAYLRDAAYRVGDGDSLNRMWIQLIPLAVLYFTVAIGAGEWRLKRASADSPTDEVPAEAR